MPKLVEIIIPKLRKYNNFIREADYVLCAPGGICMGGYKDWGHVWNLINAISLKKRTGIYGRSIGPFTEKKASERIFKNRAIQILKSVNYLSLRDEYSQAIAAELGVKYTSTVDTAFACVPDGSLPEELSYLKNRNYVVFVPNFLYLWNPFFKDIKAEIMDGFYRSVIQELLSRELDVVMLPQLFGAPKVDKPYFETLARDYDPQRVIVIDDIYDSDIQQKIISYARFVIGARYHSIIFAVNNEVPFVCLSYEHKMSETLKLLELEEYSLPLKDLIEKQAYDEFRRLLDRVTERQLLILPQIAKAKQKAERLAQEAFSAFLKSLKDSII